MQVEETAEALKPLTDFLQKTLGERVERVSVSQRLADLAVRACHIQVWLVCLPRAHHAQPGGVMHASPIVLLGCCNG